MVVVGMRVIQDVKICARSGLAGLSELRLGMLSQHIRYLQVRMLGCFVALLFCDFFAVYEFVYLSAIYHKFC